MSGVYYCIFERRDGFQKEVEMAFRPDQLASTMKLRQFSPLYAVPLGASLDTSVHVIDTNFYLKTEFYALGKHIRHYVER